MKLKSAELVNALSAAFEQLNVLTQTSVNINQNVVKAEQGNFLLFAKFFDTFYIDDNTRPSEEMVFEFFKTLTDDYAVAENATLAFTKSVNDAGYVFDRDIIAFIKGAFDEIAASDDYFFAFEKSVNEIVAGVGDQTFVFTKKAAGEIVGTTDNDVLAFAKALADNGFIAEAIDTLAYGKNLSETPRLTDTINTIGTTKALEDNVNVTDDVDGAASILDDQEMQFRKIRTDNASVAESFYRQVSFVRAFTEASGLTDVDVIAFAKSLGDGTSASESINMLTSKHIYDTPAASETLAKALTKAPFLDSALIGDATAVAAGKALLDLASTADAGSLRSQGYSDFTYFSEDYVGASTTF